MDFLLYLVSVSCCAAIMWGIYCLVWRNRPLHGCSRAYLLASLLLPAVLPLIRVPVSSVSLSGYGTLPEMRLEAVQIGGGLAVAFPWAGLFTAIYTAGCVLMAGLYIYAYIRIGRKLRQGNAVSYAGHTLLTDTGAGPGTIGRRIFFPGGTADPVMLRHELAHIRAGHRFDAALLQAMHVIFWVSPAHWLIGRELKTVHEFEADCLAARGMEPSRYAALLLSESFGSTQEFSIIHAFFHHPLKRRVMMLQNLGSPKRSMLLLAALALTGGFTSTVLIAQTKKPLKKAVEADPAPVIDMEAVKRNAVPPAGSVTLTGDGSIAFSTVTNRPMFKGNMREYMERKLRFQEEGARKGSCLVQFLVSEKGQIQRPVLLRSTGDPKLDEEALRVVREMPDWQPGTLNGKPVPVLLSLPFDFGMGLTGC